MACSLTDEQILCSKCGILTDPVTTSCEHNFCEVCIETCWENGELYLCPVCRKECDTKPELNINTALTKFVTDNMKIQENENKSNILCDFCCERKLRAVKSCLHCEASFCETHLNNHKTSPRRMKHKLINPMDNLEDYICDKHEKPLEMFCRDDQTFLCLFCTTTEHKTHDCVPIEQESSHRRTQVEEKHTDVKMMIKERRKKIKQIKNLANINKRNRERDKACSVELFTTLIRSIERCQSELLEVMEQKQKAAEIHAEDLIKELEQEMAELKMRETELENLLKTEDHIHLLQTYSSVCGPLQFKSWTNISIDTDLNTETLKKTLKCLEEKIQMELRSFFEIIQPSVIQGINFIATPETSASVSEPNLANGIFVFGSTSTDSVLKPPLMVSESSPAMRKKDASVPFIPRQLSSLGVDLGTIQKLYTVDVILDPNTAYPKLNLSKDGKQVYYEGTWRDVPNNPERFDCSACVLGKDGFCGGIFYYEVQVCDKPEWDIGVARESIKKKGKITVCPEHGFWSIWLRNGNEYMANELSPISLSIKQKPQTVGVFVDYEKGLVSFYDVENKYLIYSFIGYSFNEKLYPFLSPCNKKVGVNKKPLIIRPCNY
nr:E3 ubiquitin-protein ligase TRIM39-like [Misgurnus anguillicaudatus]